MMCPSPDSSAGWRRAACQYSRLLWHAVPGSAQLSQQQVTGGKTLKLIDLANLLVCELTALTSCVT